jgi:hypothetical protein
VKEAEEEKKHTTFKEFCLTCPVCRENIGESRWFIFPLRRIIVPSLISCGSEKKPDPTSRLISAPDLALGYFLTLIFKPNFTPFSLS